MKLYKDNLITEPIWDVLSKMHTDIVMNMIRNKIVIASESDRESIQLDEKNEWLRENCAGLIYFINESTAFRDAAVYYFEKEEDATAFKLRWG